MQYFFQWWASAVNCQLLDRRLILYRINKKSRESNITGQNQRDQRKQNNTGNAQRRPFTQDFAGQNDTHDRRRKQQSGGPQRHRFSSL